MDVEHRPYKQLDLRNISHHSESCCKKFEFGLAHKKENITTHSTKDPKSIKHRYEEVTKVLLDALKTMQLKGVHDFSTIHFYMKCTGMGQDFIFCDAGAKRKF